MTERDEQQIVAGLKALAREMMIEQAPGGLEGALRSAYRRKRSAAVWKRAAALGAIAASLVVALSAWLLRPPAKLEAPPRPQPNIFVTNPVAPPANVMARRVPKVRRPRPTAVAPVREEIVTGFLPIAGGDIFAPLDRGRVVRVRMPRSALVVFGLPVNEDRMADSVRADVLLGEDGMARAIRFVR